MGLVNKPVKVAVHQVIENRQVKNESTGKYEPSGQTRTVNECKFFGNKDGKTAEEIINKTEAVKFDKWAEKNTGSVINKASNTPKGSNSAASIMGSTPTDQADSLFAN